MVDEIIHVGITVGDMDRSVSFYRDILGMTYRGELVMEGKESDALFGFEAGRARVCYLNGSDDIMAPPVELIQFLDRKGDDGVMNIERRGISEVCFRVDDIDAMYEHLRKNGVECISSPQMFDFSVYGFSRSKAMYFRDPDGTILELIEECKD